MRLEDGLTQIKDLVGKRFDAIFTKEQLENIAVNKGKSGLILELAIGLKNTNATLDFEDGELKTNKCNCTGTRFQTMFITQITSIVDELLEKQKFEETKLYKKISNLLYVPICKDGEPDEWFILDVIHINLNLDKYKAVKSQLEEDYYSICEQLKVHIETSKDGFIHTSNGKYIQIRSKDRKPYHPIYSGKYERNISNKYHAFYFKTRFMKYILELEREKM